MRRRFYSVSIYLYHTVANAHMRLQELVVLSVGIQLLSQGCNKNSERGYLVSDWIRPKLVKDRFVGYYLADIFCKYAEQLVLKKGKMYLLTVYAYLTGGVVDIKVSVYK